MILETLIVWMKVGVICIGILVATYVLTRLLSSGVFRSYFESKHKYEREAKNEKKQKKHEGSPIEKGSGGAK